MAARNIQICNLMNTTCRQPCQIKTHLSQVHSHSFFASFLVFQVDVIHRHLFHERVRKVFTCKRTTPHATIVKAQDSTITSRRLFVVSSTLLPASYLRPGRRFARRKRFCRRSHAMCNIGQVGESTRVGIPRIAAHSTARTFTGYVGSSQGTREHRFLIVSVPDTRRSCHVILHCTEESESEGGQVDFHRTLDRRSPSRTTILPIRYQIYWKLGLRFSQSGILSS